MDDAKLPEFLGKMVGGALVFASALSLPAFPALAMPGSPERPATEKEMAALVASCEASAEARAARHAKEPLYERLGGYERIHELSTEILRLNGANPAIGHFFENVDMEKLARHVADFVAAGTGGTAEYTGRSMPAAHAHLKLTDADFLAANDDTVRAMEAFGYGQDEVDEVLCILLSLKDQVGLE